MPDLETLQKILGISFTNITFLEQALVHRSFLNENPNFPLLSNERLEFLGDAVLNFVIAERLFQEFPHFSEGELTQGKASLVSKETLAHLALSLDLGSYLYLGRGEEISGGRHKQTNLINALEAIIGAIFIDQGLAKAKDFIFKLINPKLLIIKEKGITLNYKTLLQEYAQKEYRQTPIYRVIETTGPNHDKSFTVEVIIGDKRLAEGSGKSKRSAEMEAARLAWEKLNLKL